ncbi:MAG: HAD-IIIA family hydrolase [Bacteroidales bacterium]|nr:HAD-IIIA family hydrolase [Bacteroidales bacterium]
MQITDIYICPHHDKSERCLCRKPQSIMLEKAIARFDINVKESYFFGDSKRDIEAGNAVGVNSILVQPNTNLIQHISLLS